MDWLHPHYATADFKHNAGPPPKPILKNGLILPGAVSIATWLTPLAALGLAVVMVGATAFHVSRKETLATVAAASLALLMIFLACGRTFVVPLH